jgi:hypothetical protein
MDCIFCGSSRAKSVDARPRGRSFDRDPRHRPQAPTHVLVIPRQHVASLWELDDERLAGRSSMSRPQIARAEKLEKRLAPDRQHARARRTECSTCTCTSSADAGSVACSRSRKNLAHPHGGIRSFVDKLVIEGGHPLEGTIETCGSKNAVLPVMAAALLTIEELVVPNAPLLSDVNTMASVLRDLEVFGRAQRRRFDEHALVEDVVQRADWENVRKMRGSVP